MIFASCTLVARSLAHALVLPFLLFFLHTGPLHAQSAPEDPQLGAKNILLLYSYGHGGKGMDVFDEGLLAALDAAGIKANQLYFEYLDLERTKEDGGHRERLRDFLMKKYAGRNIDLIMTGQQPAQNFLLNEARTLALGAPVIMIQAPVPTAEQAAGRRVFSQVAQFDIRGTLERALEIFPNTKRIVIVAGASVPDQKIAAAAAGAAAPWQGKVEFEYTGHLTLDALLARVASLPPDTIVVFTQFNRDAAGRVVLAYEVEGMITKVANAPVFGLYDFNLRNGGIGGSVISVNGLGTTTAQLMLEILSGKRQSGHAVTVIDNKAAPLFDWQQIERWRGDANRLPTNTVFVNRTLTLWEQYKWYYIGVAFFILLQSTLIAALVLSRRRRALAESMLRESEERYRVLVEQAPDAILVYDLDLRRFVDANGNAERLFGCGRARLLSTGPEAFYAEEQPDGLGVAESMSRNVARAVAGESVVFERAVRTADGRNLLCEARLSRLPSLKHRLLRGSFIDVTERKRAETELAREAERTAALLGINEMGGALSEGEFLQRGLEQAERLTGSKIAFLHFVNEDQETIELVTWSARTRTNCAAVFDKHYPVSKAGIWADCLRQRQATIFNDYPGHPAKRGLPGGHAPLARLISVPVIEEGKAHVILGVGNKASDYDQFDAETVQLIGNDLWRIVHRMRAEAALREAEERWKFALEGAGDGVWDWNTQTGDLILSKRCLEIFGFAAGEVAPRIEEWVKRVHPDDLARVKADVMTFLDGKAVNYVHECRVRCKDGTWKWALARGMVVSRDADGRPLRMIGTQSDISERRESEESSARQLKELRQWYEVTLGREDRLRQLKAEVNELRERLGEPPRYQSEAATGVPAES